VKVLLLCAKAFETMEFSVFIDVIGWTRESFTYYIPKNYIYGEVESKRIRICCNKYLK